MKKLTILLLSFFSLLWGFSLAQDVTSLVVEVSPSTIKTGEPADITVKAVDENGDVVDTYDGEIYMSISSSDWTEEIWEDDYTLPQDGTYAFGEEDMWEKTFSKWLMITKPWTYKLEIEDFLDPNIRWEAEVTVIWEWDWNITKGNITILSPNTNEIIKSSSMDVIWKSDFKNSKMNVFIDNELSTNGMSDWNGDFNISVSGLTNWEHKLVVKVVDIDGNVIWQSDEISFKVEVWSDFFKQITITPSNVVDQWTTITATVKTTADVTTAILSLEWLQDYPMEKAEDGVFKTDILMDKPGVFNVSLKLNVQQTSKNYPSVEKITVKEKKAIWQVKFVRDNVKKTIDLDWKYTGQIPMFKVSYWTEKNNLSENATTDINKFQIQNIIETATYYVKIYPIDANWNIIWEESKLITIEPDMKKAASCNVDNIKVNIVKKDSNNYLEWEKVEWATQYIIYRWDTKDNLSELTTTKQTSYKLPFDPNAKKVTYAYFAVKAACDDWTLQQIDNVKKVKVGPMDFAIWAGIISMILYSLSLAYKK